MDLASSKKTLLLVSFAIVHFAVHAATIDRMTFNRFAGGVYSAPDFPLPNPADTYYLSDGTSWRSGAGVSYPASTTYQSTAVSNDFVFYHFAPLTNGIMFRQTDFGAAGEHSSQGTLGWSDEIVLVAQIGSTEARFSGYTTILDNSVPVGTDPSIFNPFSASPGQSVYFQMDFTIYGTTWQPDTFNQAFPYSIASYVDFTQVIPEPHSSALFLLAAGLFLLARRSRPRSQAIAS